MGACGACQETRGGGGSWNWRAGCWNHSLAVMQSMLHTEVLDWGNGRMEAEAGHALSIPC